MIVLFPLLLVAAANFALRRVGAGRASEGEWRWFAAWSVAGASMTLSFLTGLSIGLFVLPVAAVLLLWVARRAPHPADALGFVQGVGALLIVVAVLNRSGNGLDPMPWLLAGLGLSALAPLGYLVLRRHA